jgi:hypothetical protein
MLRFIHAVGLLKLAVLVPVHACTHKIILVFVCGTYVPTLAYLWYLVNFLFVLWDQKCCNVTNIKYASCPREQMMASNVSILDTEVAQAIVLLGIEGRVAS